MQPKLAAAQQAADRNAVLASDGTGDQAATGDVGATVPKPGIDATSGMAVVEPVPVLNRRFFGVVRLNPERYGRDFSRIAQEVLQHLAAVEGTALEVTVEISATNDEGFPPDKVRVVTENAATLKFDQHGFEGR